MYYLVQGEAKIKLMLVAIEKDNFIKLEDKINRIKMCERLKNELEVLFLKLQRYKEIHITRYNNLASYLNANSNFKTLASLELYKKNIEQKLKY